MASSSMGGYLVGIESSIEGQTLDRFLNSFLSGITGINSTLVRPSWQLNPPKMPINTVNWIGYGAVIIDSDQNAYIEAGTNTSILKRNEYGELSLFVYGPDAFIMAKRVRDSLQIGQNRDYLRANGITTKGVQPLNHVPELIGDIWYNRIDMTIEFAREILTSYNVQSITSIQTGSIVKSDTFSHLDPLTGTELIYQS